MNGLMDGWLDAWMIGWPDGLQDEWTRGGAVGLMGPRLGCSLRTLVKLLMGTRVADWLDGWAHGWIASELMGG